MDRIADKLDVAEDLFPVYMFLFTIQGIPSVYYGSEFGIHGRKADGSDAPLRPKLILEDMEETDLTPLDPKSGPAAFFQKRINLWGICGIIADKSPVCIQLPFAG